jgi:hypothetical protein
MIRKVSIFLLFALTAIFLYIGINWNNISKTQKQIHITENYIINEFWDEKYNHAIKIERLIRLDNRLDVTSKEFRESFYWDFETSFKVKSDSETFSFWSPKICKNDTVFFDKSNGWKWHNGVDKVSTIGKLERNQWYKFSNLRMNTKFYKYVFIDTEGKAHIFNMNKANF